MFVYRYPTVGELRVVDIGSCGGSDRPDMTSVGPDVDAAMFTCSTDVYAAWSYEDRAADLVVDYPAETAVGGRTVTVPQVIPAGRMQFSGLRFHQPGQVRVVCVTDPAKAALLREGDPYLYGALFHNHGIVCPAIVVDYDTATWVQADIPGLGLCLALDLRAVDESTATLFDETSQMCVAILSATQLPAANIPASDLIGTFDGTSRAISYTHSKDLEVLQGRFVVTVPWFVQGKVGKAIASSDLSQSFITFYDRPQFLSS